MGQDLRPWLFRSMILAVALSLLACQVPAATVPADDASQPEGAQPRDETPLRLFWINSYTEEDRSALQIQTGAWEALAREGYNKADGSLVWESYHLGISQSTSMAEVRPLVSGAAAAIRAFEPEAVIISDDEAVQTMVSEYAGISAPVIYCGVSAPVETIGLLDTDAVGVVERLNPRQTVAMAREFVGGEGEYLVIGDASVTGRPSTLTVYDELQLHSFGSDSRLLGDAVVEVADDWLDWKKAVLRTGADVDFIVLASYQPLIDERGQPVSEDAMMAWMVKHAPAPVFALWNSAVVNGAVGGLVADRYQQGRYAAQLALRAARNLEPSASNEMASGMNRLVLNAAAAQHWGLKIPVLFPIVAQVYNTDVSGSVPVAQGGSF